MKRIITVVLAGTLIIATSHQSAIAKLPEYPETINIEKVSRQYLQAIQSSNEGLVESALFESIKLQIFVAKHNFPELARAADKVIEKTQNPELRYKAYVVAQYLHRPNWLHNMENINEVWESSRFDDTDGGDKLFALLADELQNHYLAIANNDCK